MILSLHKNECANNNKLPKLKLVKNKHTYKNKSAADKPAWNKQTESVKSSSTLRDLKLDPVWKQIGQITVNGTPMTIGATTTKKEGNLNMSQVTPTLEMEMAEMEGIPIEMTTRDTATGHQVSQVC